MARGIVADSEHIAIGADELLRVGRSALRPGSRVGWTVPWPRMRLNDAGQYLGRVERIISLDVDQRITIRFGDAVIHGLAGNADRAAAGCVCRFDIDRDAVRIWPLG